MNVLSLALAFFGAAIRNIWVRSTFFRYSVVGTSGTLVFALCYYVLTEKAGASHPVAVAIGTVPHFAISVVLYKLKVFRCEDFDRRIVIKQILLCALAWSAIMLANIGILELLVQGVSLSHLLAEAIAFALMTPPAYIAKRWIFAPAPR